MLHLNRHVRVSTVIRRRRSVGLALVPIALFALLVACTPIQPPPPAEVDAAVATPAPLADIDLASATYQGIYEEPVQLVGGEYEGEPFSEGSAMRPRVVLGELRADGDLDGDGDLDSAVLLGENSGGSGTFIFLAAVLNDNGNPVNAATTILGDRVQIERFVIVDGQIALDLIVHGPTDPMCCPSKAISQTWALTENELTLTGGVTAADAAMDVGNTMQFGPITFNYEPTLAQGWQIEEIADNRPEDPSPPSFETGPARVVFTAEGFAGADETMIAPALYIYQMADLADSPEGEVAAQLADLLDEQPDPMTLEELPFLPLVGAAQVLHGNAFYTSFDHGDGIGLRYITYYAQDAAPLQGSRFWYTFQGMTNADGVYVAAVFPVTTDLFDDTVPAELDYDAFIAEFDEYLATNQTTINGALPADFTPNLSQLDALMRSLVIDEQPEP